MFKKNTLIKKLTTDKINNFCNKKNFDFEEFVKNKYNRIDNSEYVQNKNDNISGKRIRKSHLYLESQRNSLVDKFKNELIYFKFEPNFDINDLRHKYLQLAKLYHPDIRKNDKFSNSQFTKLKESYEKLKIYCEMREELENNEEKIDDDGNLFVNTITFDFEEKYLDDRKDIIKQILIEEEFGDIKEPKNAIRNLLIIWLFIGILVNYYELKKYIKKLNIRREDIDYNMSLKEHIFK